MTVSVECGHWFVSVVTEMDFANDGPRRPGEVGIDLGIAQTVTLSDGTVFQLDVESIKKHEKQIAVLQRQLCRNKETRQKLAKLGKANPFDKREPSRKRRRLKAKIQNHHRCIRNIRRDFMLKTAHTIAQNYVGVAMEDLKLKNMTKSAKGTVEEPGKNVRQKDGLEPVSGARCALRDENGHPLGCIQGQWTTHSRRSEIHEPDLPNLRMHEFVKSTFAGAFRLSEMRVHRECRRRGGNQCPQEEPDRLSSPV